MAIVIMSSKCYADYPNQLACTLHVAGYCLNSSTMLSKDYTITKRQLGILMFIIGILGGIGILAIDLVGGGQDSGIGPAQLFALGIMVVVAIVGLTLIPLGDTPA